MTMRRYHLLSTAVLAATLVTALPATASSFSVAPIRVELDKSHRTGVLTLHNEGDTAVVVQVTAVSWNQDNGEEHFEEARDVLVTPPVFEVPSKGEQIVRIALKRDADPAVELAYRVFFEEVPQARTPTFNGLNVALRIGLPIFITPPVAVSPEVAWEAEWQDDGSVTLAATNRGREHLQVTGFDLEFGAGGPVAHVAGSKYVLPGSRMTWSVSPPVGADRTAALHLTGAGDHGAIDAAVALHGR